jgi:hypothetical protein
MRHEPHREAGQIRTHVAGWLAVIALLLALIALLSTAFGLRLRGPAPDAAAHDLVGAWRATVDFESGAFAAFGDLEFMYVFNAGGTMTESSNYDGAPPVPPAYGIWRRTGPSTFEAKYQYYATRPPADLDDIVGGGGWMPAGHGVFIETITLYDDGRTFESTMRYEGYDKDGARVDAGDAHVRGVRLEF